MCVCFQTLAFMYMCTVQCDRNRIASAQQVKLGCFPLSAQTARNGVIR